MTKTEEIMEMVDKYSGNDRSIYRNSLQAYNKLKAAIEELVADANAIRAKERERCAMVIENGHFLHDQAPDKLFANQASKAIRSLE